jgi:hypothetical protein
MCLLMIITTNTTHSLIILIKHNIIKSRFFWQVKSVILCATIKGVCKDIPWLYEGCSKCKFKVTSTMVSSEQSDGSTVDEKKVYICKNDNCLNKETTPVTRFVDMITNVILSRSYVSLFLSIMCKQLPALQV